MSTKALYRIGLIASIVSTASWIVYVVAQPSTPSLTGITDPQQFFQTIQESRTTFLLYGWSGVVGTLLSIPYLLAFYTAIKERAPAVHVALTIALIGAGLATIGFFKSLTLVYEYLPLGVAAEPETLPMLKVAAEASLEVMELPWNMGSFLLFGVGVGLMAYYALRAAIGPKWLNWVGIVGGLSGIVWLMAYLSFLVPVAVLLIMVNILTIIVWSIGLSVSLVRHSPDRFPETELSERPVPI